MQQLALAVALGLGLPGLILGVAAQANRWAEDPKVSAGETTVWTAPTETTDSEAVSP